MNPSESSGRAVTSSLDDSSSRFALPTQSLVQLAVPPDTLVTSKIREFVVQYCQKVFFSDELIHSLEMTTHELLENAIKYSPEGSGWPTLEISAGGSRLIVRATNRASAEHRASLAAYFDEIKANPDPQRHYQVLMQRAASRTVGSGLGLGRVRSEAGMTLSLSVEGDRVTLQASRPLVIQ
jgi:hypothetical protein